MRAAEAWAVVTVYLQAEQTSLRFRAVRVGRSVDTETDMCKLNSLSIGSVSRAAFTALFLRRKYLPHTAT